MRIDVRFLLLAVSFIVCIWTSEGHAHEIRPAFLGIRDIGAGQCEVVWKIPARRGATLKITPNFPDDWKETVVPSRIVLPDEVVERRTFRMSKNGLDGVELSVTGLSDKLVDVLLLVERSDGRSHSAVLRAFDSTFLIPTKESIWEAVQTYLDMGVRHILLGIDHLLFVLGLLLLISSPWLLLKTITSFTVAHSITLALATLGFLNIPPAPVEILIALSIVFLAGELVRSDRDKSSLTIRKPWLVSFGFGLLHGLGFAGALVDLGLPHSEIPVALLFFNLGVEIGQLLFVLVVFMVMGLLHRIKFKFPERGKQIPVYIMGGVASFWCIGRFFAMIGR
jgi:hypothetical protein